MRLAEKFRRGFGSEEAFRIMEEKRKMLHMKLDSVEKSSPQTEENDTVNRW